MVSSAAVVGCWGGATRCSAAPPAPRLPSPPHPETIPILSRTPRRAALLLLFSIPVPSAAAAPALSFGISGPKEWLKEQKRKAAKFVLAPIEASRQSIRNAYDMLELDLGTPMDYQGEVRRLLNSASRDCVPQDRSSLVAFQASTGVEVCTFRLILKNASSLLDDEDPVKLEAEAKLGDLIRSFSSIGSVIDNSDFQLIDDRQKVKDGLMDTIYSLNKFEQGIKDCLGA
ncbi:hypothetical protein J5N97_008645 [Dioscorea zingiberensis]|uniref:Uncharacterized protein n=1 Tax=Dioscorea zingiberensis TaxID=325984 RepID=A0A9D5CV55_9LILI|nr:hypothetical protein J5N97_008645 [Dioscorea zingiberensis]